MAEPLLVVLGTTSADDALGGAGVEQRLRRIEGLVPEETVDVPLTPPHEYPSAASLASELRARLEGIDDEIRRVEEH